MSAAQTAVMCFSILVVVGSSALYLYGARIKAAVMPFLRWMPRTTQFGFMLISISLVFWVANWVSIDAGKGWQPMCTIIGCMLFGAGLMAMILAGGRERGRE